MAGGHVDIVQKDTSSQIGSDVSNNGSESATPASATTGPQRGVDTLTKGQPPPGPTGSTSAVRGAQQNGAVPTVPGMVSKQAIIENLIKTKGVSWMGAGVGERAGKALSQRALVERVDESSTPIAGSRGIKGIL